jgi:invasion protein IalB
MMMATNRLRLLAAAALLSAAAIAGDAAAQQNPQPAASDKRPAKSKEAEKSGTRFEDWRLGCERRRDNDQEACFIEQRVAPKETPDRLALAMAIGYFAPGGKPAMIIKLPPTAVKEAGIIIRVDDRQTREVTIRQCGRDNCSVMALVDDDLMGEMRAGKQAIVAYSRKESQDIVRVPVSLRGLTRGLAALRKR